MKALKYFKWCLNLDPISINVLNQSSLCLKSAYFGEIGLKQKEMAKCLKKILK